MAIPPYLRVRGDVIYLHVKVQPRASKNEIAGVLGDELKIKIAAPPVDSAANDALVRFLAELIECPRQRVQLLRGATSRHKVVALHGLAVEHVTKSLAAAADR